MIPKILEVISSYSSAQIVDDKKEAVVGEAAITLRWILIRCGAIAFDEQSNSFVLGATYRAKVHDMMSRKFANQTDFFPPERQAYLGACYPCRKSRYTKSCQGRKLHSS